MTTMARTINRPFLPPEFAALAENVDRLSRTRGELKRRHLGSERIRRQLTGPVTERRNALQARLDAQMTWLMANPGHPREAEREEQWRAGLNQYCALCDLLDDATTAGLLDCEQPELTA